MKRTKKYIFQIILIAAISIISSCTPLGSNFCYTYKGKKIYIHSIYRPTVGQTEYRGGYWGNWEKNNLLRYVVNYTYTGFEITYFNKFNHPSDFEYKIVAKNRKSPDGEWEVYDGEIHIKKSNEASMRSKYTKDITGVNALKDVWVFPATIKRTYQKLPEEKYIIPPLPTEMMYVYNVYYNGVGRAFQIDGTWVSAEPFEYDPWI